MVQKLVHYIRAELQIIDGEDLDPGPIRGFGIRPKAAKPVEHPIRNWSPQEE